VRRDGEANAKKRMKFLTKKHCLRSQIHLGHSSPE